LSALLKRPTAPAPPPSTPLWTPLPIRHTGNGEMGIRHVITIEGRDLGAHGFVAHLILPTGLSFSVAWSSGLSTFESRPLRTCCQAPSFC
jgi:hypothetical protein